MVTFISYLEVGRGRRDVDVANLENLCGEMNYAYRYKTETLNLLFDVVDQFGIQYFIFLQGIGSMFYLTQIQAWNFWKSCDNPV